MQKFMKKRKARGFTLVELLIVIIIIGILAGAMLLVAGAGTDKAEATKIVSNLRNIKSGMLMYYADNGEWVSTVASFVDLEGYVDTSISSDKYDITSDDGKLWVGYKGVKDGVDEKLAKLAVEGGYYNAASTNSKYSEGDSNVWVMVK